MTIAAASFTPEVLLSAPRRSAAVPNNAGTMALYTVSTYSFEDHKKTVQIKVLDMRTGLSTALVEDMSSSEPTWIGENEFMYIKSGDRGFSSLVLVDGLSGEGGKRMQLIHTFDGSISNIKVKKLSDGILAFACSALATPSGELANPATEPRPHSTAKVYSSLFVRHWDTWNTPNRSAIWYGVLRKSHDAEAEYELAQPLVNALKGTPLESPVPPFGGAGDFDIGTSGLLFVAKDPKLDQALYTKTDVYYVPLMSFTEPEAPKPRIIHTPGLEGYSASPVFSHSGRRVAFTRMRNKQYETDKPRILLWSEVGAEAHFAKTELKEFYVTEDGEGGWDRKPEAVAWSADDETLFVTSEEKGRTYVFSLPSNPDRATDLPTRLNTGDGSVSDFRVFGKVNAVVKAQAVSSSKLFVTSSSLVDSSWYSVLDPSTSTLSLVSSLSKNGRTFNLSRQQVDDFWFPGADDTYQCHALLVRPSDFSPSKKYPLAFLIHGGPQGAWGDSWSTRWNPAIFAEQGYVVVAPNPTGSSGYGMALQDGITGQWGGRPYEDLVSCFNYIGTRFSYIDTTNAVALGASYGGYMINWIQGHELGRKFKALVCHDGVFSTGSQWGTEELFFPTHDFEGTLWGNKKGYEKWDPAIFTGEWATPQLVIHSELDYRLPMPEGLAAFNVLQARGVPSKLLVFPDENHWVLKPENSLVWHREVLGWINKWTGLDGGQDKGKQVLRVSAGRA